MTTTSHVGPDMTISQHAAERYAERIRPCSVEEAKRQLAGIAPVAALEEELVDGERWLRAGCLRLVVYADHVVTCYIVGGAKNGDS